MNYKFLRELLLYRYRYVAGLAVFAVVLIGLVLVRPDLAPSGLSQLDLDSAVRSTHYNITRPVAQSTLELPFILLQKLSIHFLGVTEFAVRLPAAILGIVTGAAFMMMVRRWFRLNIALITSVIFVTSSAFLTLARTGHATIMTTFWLSLFLLAVTNIIHPDGKTRLWLAVLFVIVPFSLYTPLMIYPFVAVAFAGLLHPHVRFTLKHIRHWQYALGVAFFILSLTPLILTLSAHPDQMRELVGIPTHVVTSQEILANAKTVIKSFFNLGNAIVGEVPQPLFGAASFIIIVLGFLQTVRDRFSARSYMLLIWSAMFIPLALFNPDKLLICLVPAYLYMAIGIETLIGEWYRLFPRNPYARLIGFFPLLVLISGIMLSNSAQYFYGHFYGSPTTRYSRQLMTTRNIMDSHHYKDKPTRLVVVPAEREFYELLRRDYPNMSVVTSAPSPIDRPTIVHDGVTTAIGTPKLIVTSYATKSDQAIARLYTP